LRAAGGLSLILVFFLLIYFVIVSSMFIRRLMVFKNSKARKVVPLLITQNTGIVILLVHACAYFPTYSGDTFNSSLFLADWWLFWFSSTLIIFAQLLIFRVQSDNKTNTRASNNSSETNQKNTNGSSSSIYNQN
jgi:hypothetical protein